MFFTIIVFFWGVQRLRPLTLTIVILWTSLIVRILTLVLVHKWFFYVIALFYLGGIIILFVYIVRLLSSEKIINLFPSKTILFLLTIFVITTDPRVNLNSFYQVRRVYKLFEEIRPRVLALALLIILLIVVKLCDMWSGPLKSYINE